MGYRGIISYVVKEFRLFSIYNKTLHNTILYHLIENIYNLQFGGMQDRIDSNMPPNFLDVNSYSSEYA